MGMMPMHPQVVTERVSRFRLDWMSHVFEAGLEQARHGEPTPPAMIEKGLGSVYAQRWTKIGAAKLAAVPEAAIVEVLHAPPKPKPLAVVDVDQPSHEPEKAVVKEEPATPAVENEDWETDVVLQNVGSGARP